VRGCLGRCEGVQSLRVLVAPQGFEPRSSESESLVLPLNEGAMQGWCRCGVANKCVRRLPFRVYCVGGFGSMLRGDGRQRGSKTALLISNSCLSPVLSTIPNKGPATLMGIGHDNAEGSRRLPRNAVIRLFAVGNQVKSDLRDTCVSTGHPLLWHLLRSRPPQRHPERHAHRELQIRGIRSESYPKA
jgi:hypothetical protein